MAYIDVGSWPAEHVVYWLRGIHSSLESKPMNQFIRRRINGNRLMLLATEDIADLIPAIKVEALQTIMQGISMLRTLGCRSASERVTLQTLTLNLACQAKYLYNILISGENSPCELSVSSTSLTPLTAGGVGDFVKDRFDFSRIDTNTRVNHSPKQRVSLGTLDGVSTVVDQISQVVDWLNVSGMSTNGVKFNKDFKDIILRVAVELTSTAQRDQFVEYPNDIMKKTSKFLADYCEWVVLAIDDPDFIQPCWLDVVSVKRKPEEDDFGIDIQLGTLNELVIEEVVFSSPAHRSGRITIGDEIIQVDYQTVVGWTLENVTSLIKTYTGELILTIRKKPAQSLLNPSVVVMRPYAIPLKRVQSHHSSDAGGTLDEISLDGSDIAMASDKQPSFNTEMLEVRDESMEPPKEPKGPVYPEIQAQRSKRELKRRMSISGDISDALVDLSLADSLPIPSLEKTSPPSGIESEDKSRLGRISKDALKKAVSHDTAKLYLHTLSIDRKHLFINMLPKSSGAN